MKKYIVEDCERSMLQNQINMWDDNGYELHSICLQEKIFGIGVFSYMYTLVFKRKEIC